MIPNRFSYCAPSGPEQVVAELAAAEGTGSVLSGGTWLVPEMGRGTARPTAVIDLRNAGLGMIAAKEGRLTVGATCSYADLLRAPPQDLGAPMLSAMASGITGGRQIQGQGTIGGSACKARPSSDAPTALVAQGGVAIALGPGGQRRIAIEEFFLGAERNALDTGELLTGFELDVHPAAAWGYYKLKHSGSSWPIVTAAARLFLDEEGGCSAAALVVGGVGERPTQVEVGEVLAGRRPDEEALREAAALVVAAVSEPYTDELASADYRLAVAAPTALRALRRALGQNKGKGDG